MEHDDDQHDFDFDTWSNLLEGEIRKLGYEGPVDKYTFEEAWEKHETPEKVAKDFMAEMNS